MILRCIMQVMLTLVGSISGRATALNGFSSWCDSPSLSMLLVCCEACLCDNGNSLKGRSLKGMLKMCLQLCFTAAYSRERGGDVVE